jgi:hypothetical protein
MDQVRDAAFDSQFRIVVVGDTRCSGNASTDVGVLRFTESGADDTSFSGDGGLGFKFKPDFDGRDRGHAVLVLADDSLLVAGGYKFPSVESGYVQRVSSSGVVQQRAPHHRRHLSAQQQEPVVDPGGRSAELAGRDLADRQQQPAARHQLRSKHR